MVDIRKVMLVAVLAIVTLAPRSVMAAASYTDTAAGAEVAATSTQGQFVGAATGQLPGAWYISVDHQPLAGATPVAITGGSISIVTWLNGGPATVTGSFSGGSVVQTGGFTGCADQTFAVKGSLSNVGVGNGTGTGAFSATLTHYQVLIFGRCITYSASITSSVALTF